MKKKIVIRKKNCAFKKVEDEIVLIHPEGGSFIALNEVGSRIWELADGTMTIEEIIAEIAREFEEEKSKIEKDTIEFLEELEKKEIISFRSKEKEKQ